MRPYNTQILTHTFDSQEYLGQTQILSSTRKNFSFSSKHYLVISCSDSTSHNQILPKKPVSSDALPNQTKKNPHAHLCYVIVRAKKQKIYNTNRELNAIRTNDRQENSNFSKRSLDLFCYADFLGTTSVFTSRSCQDSYLILIHC